MVGFCGFLICSKALKLIITNAQMKMREKAKGIKYFEFEYKDPESRIM